MEFLEEREREERVDLLSYWKIITKRKWLVIAVTTILILFVGFFSFTATPIYRATATLLIEETPSNMLNIQELLRYVPYRTYDYMNRDFNTQLRLLTSRALAERVARKMNLRARPEFHSVRKPGRSFVHTIKNIISLRWIFRLIPRKKTPSPGPQPRRQLDPNSMMAFVVMGGLSVSPLRNTKIVRLSYSSPYPVLAADIVNTVAEEFINYSIETRYEATQQASEFLSEQIAQLREDLAAKERELQKYGEKKELLMLSDKENPIVGKFSNVYNAFTQAQLERIKTEANYRELKDLKVDSLPQFINNPIIQRLKTEYSTIKAEYEEKSKIFKPDYPQMIQLKARLDNMRQELEQEIRKAVDAAESEYKTAQKKEASIKELLDKQKVEVNRMSSNAILYNSLK
ncbi:MAG: GumC family protein, partial [Candidatus Aminicenantales bacterium]